MDGDETPPSLSVLFFPQGGTGIPNDLAGIYFGGDSMQLSAFPSDNHELRELDWWVLPAGAGIDGALTAIDLREPPWEPILVPLTLLDSASNQHPANVRTLSNGKVFVSLQGNAPSAYVLAEVDLATGEQRLRTDAGQGGHVGGGTLGRSLDHSVIVVNGGPTFFQRYDVATQLFGARRSASINDITPAVDGTGRYIAVGLDIYDASLQHLRRVSSPIIPGGTVPTALSPDGQSLYQLLSSAGVLRSGTVDGALLDRAFNPISAAQFRISDDGTMLVTATVTFERPVRISTIDLR